MAAHCALLLWLWVLQVCDVGGVSVLNGTVGETIVLPVGVDGLAHVTVLQWKRNHTIIIQFFNGTGYTLMDEGFKGRLSMNNKTGSLTISSLREEDSGEYVFSGFGSSGSFKPTKIKLQVYERIISVQVNYQVSYSPDNTTCNVTLTCTVSGGSQVALSWSRDGERIPGVEDRQTVILPITENIYSCTASNPISSQTATVTVNLCQTYAPVPLQPLVMIVASGAAAVVVIMVVTVICFLTQRKKGEEVVSGETEEDVTVYAEVGEFPQKDICHSESLPSTLYAVVKNKDSAATDSPQNTDVTTCYDVIKGTDKTTPSPSLYDTVNFDRLKATQYQYVT